MAELIGRIGEPVDYRGDWQAQEEDQLYRFRQQFRSATKGDAVGEVVRWQRADGYACYMVASEEPLQLAHIDHGDAYQVEPALIRGINLEEIKQMVDHERAMSELFSKKESS
jgi:hypothetical protein